jgi:DNA-3-methyladenine glycosylase I
MSYCTFCNNRPEDDAHRKYHDKQYGYPVSDDNELFGRLLLEINQAGLSWDTILKKEQSFRKAFLDFNLELVVQFNKQDEERLMADTGIIRNRLKIQSAIFNAKQIKEIIGVNGSFSNWLDLHHPKSLEEWNKLFKKTFKFVGVEIVREFLMSTGYLSGAHREDCPIFEKIAALSPKWMEQ